jgi:putative transposase
MRHINHVISRRLVNKAIETQRGLALEDLTGIRQRTHVRKTQRYRQQSWAFYQLRTFIAYKAVDSGIPQLLINPAGTSKECHLCGEVGQRDGLLFRCATHGVMDADWNASCNISIRGAACSAA